MEEILKQILSEVKDLKEGQLRLEGRFDKLEGKFEEMSESHKKLVEKVDIMDHKLDAVYNQTANLTEFRTETIMKLDVMLDNLNTVEKELE